MATCVYFVYPLTENSQMSIPAVQEERNTISHGQLVIIFPNGNIRILLLHLEYVNS